MSRSARPDLGEPYQINTEVLNIGKNVEGSKKKIVWRFGYTKRKEEVEIVFLHSISSWSSGKKTIFEDGKEVTSEGSKLATDFGWTWRSLSCPGKLFRVEFATTIASGTLYNFSTDGVSYSDLPSRQFMFGNNFQPTGTSPSPTKSHNVVENIVPATIPFAPTSAPTHSDRTTSFTAVPQHSSKSVMRVTQELDFMNMDANSFGTMHRNTTIAPFSGGAVHQYSQPAVLLRGSTPTTSITDDFTPTAADFKSTISTKAEQFTASPADFNFASFNTTDPFVPTVDIFVPTAPASILSPGKASAIPSSSTTSWLGARLLSSGCDAALAQDCEQKLVRSEGFFSERDFASQPAEEINAAYFHSIGISGKGIQHSLMQLHRELQEQHASPHSAKQSGFAGAPSPDYVCGGIQIEDVQDLFANSPRHLRSASTRQLMRGRFSHVGPFQTTQYQCVIKCAGAGETSISALHREFDVYKRLKASGALTGCVACYYLHPSAHYLVMEEHGQDLRALLSAQLKNAQLVVQAVVSAVSALHGHGIMHGDIKPHNLLYKVDHLEGYVVKLCDLDAARPVGELCVASSLGTKYYVPPEVYRAGTGQFKASLSVDMFALGLVVWQIMQRSAQPALAAADEGNRLHDCYCNQATLNEFLPLPAKSGFYQEYLRDITSIEPHKRVSAHNLLVKLHRLTASNAQQDLYQEQSQSNKLRAMTAMLHTLVRGTHSIPTLAVILPFVNSGHSGIGSAFRFVKEAPMSLVRHRYRLYYLCSHTHQVARCGPEGKGYEINVTKQWVLDAAPVLRVGLLLLKVALLAGGLPLPVPDISPLLQDAGVQAKYLDAALSLVQRPLEDAGASELAMDSVASALDELQDQDGNMLSNSLGVGKAGQRSMAMVEGSPRAYESIQALLSKYTKKGESITRTCGLRQVTHEHKGETAWVLDNDATERAYQQS